MEDRERERRREGGVDEREWLGLWPLIIRVGGSSLISQ